jgi:hypothetical protein
MKISLVPPLRCTLAILTVIFLGQCQSKHSFDLQNLEGTWIEDTQKDYSFMEVWKEENNGSLSGQGLEVNQGNTSLTENLEIIEENNQFVYKATVVEQNGGNTVSFPTILENENEIIFENLQHDFPQNIHYKIISPDKLQITVSAKGDGHKQEFVLNMKRK